jgi:hypothetical protein
MTVKVTGVMENHAAPFAFVPRKEEDRRKISINN